MKSRPDAQTEVPECFQITRSPASPSVLGLRFEEIGERPVDPQDLYSQVL